MALTPRTALLIMGVAYVYYESAGKDAGSRMWDLLIVLAISYVGSEVVMD